MSLSGGIIVENEKPTMIKDNLNMTQQKTIGGPEGPIKQKTKQKKHQCGECMKQMDYMQVEGCMNYVCAGCGYIEDIMSEDSEVANSASYFGYNTMQESSMPIKIAGKNAHIYQKRITSATADYNNTQRRATHNQITKMTCFAENGKVPNNIINKASEDYHKFQQFYVKRGDVRKGIMAWLVYELCIDSGLDRTPKEISHMFEISQSELSEGCKIVKDARQSGQLGTVKALNEEDLVKSKLNRYFAILEIDQKYRDFVDNLIHFIYVTRHQSKHSGIKARCAGAIYALTLAQPDLGITRAHIAEKCNISQATFVRFTNIIIEIYKLEKTDLTRRKLAHIYKKHGIDFLY